MDIQPQGHIVPLKTTNSSHYGAPQIGERSTEGDFIGSFGAMMKGAIESVNGKQVQADSLVIQAGTHPDSVQVHDVMNAVAEAELSLNLTKAIIDRGIQSYEKLINMR